MNFQSAKGKKFHCVYSFKTRWERACLCLFITRSTFESNGRDRHSDIICLSPEADGSSSDLSFSHTKNCLGFQVPRHSQTVPGALGDAPYQASPAARGDISNLFPINALAREKSMVSYALTLIYLSRSPTFLDDGWLHSILCTHCSSSFFPFSLFLSLHRTCSRSLIRFIFQEKSWLPRATPSCQEKVSNMVTQRVRKPHLRNEQRC